jgi:hypothetical protein
MNNLKEAIKTNNFSEKIISEIKSLLRKINPEDIAEELKSLPCENFVKFLKEKLIEIEDEEHEYAVWIENMTYNFLPLFSICYCLDPTTLSICEPYFGLAYSVTAHIINSFLRELKLRQEIKNLKAQIDYAPGGEGYLAAKAEFEEMLK